MPTFGILDLILLLGISQGIFLAVTLLLIRNKNKAANSILSLFLALAVIMLLGRFTYVRFTNHPLLYRLATCVDSIIFLFGPILYTYARRLAFDEVPRFRLSLRHYLPAMAHVAFVLYTFTFSLKEYYTFSTQGGFSFYYLLIEVGGLLSNIFYVFLVLRLTLLYRNVEDDNLSYRQEVVVYLNAITFALSICLLLWGISTVRSYVFLKYSILFNYDTVWILMSSIIYLIGFYSLKQPEIFRMPRQTPASEINNIGHNEELKNRLQPDATGKLVEALERLMVEEKIYLNNKLTLQQLSELLETSPNDVSWLLNNIHKCGFYEFINRYRINDFVERIKRGEHKKYTLQTISMDVGFNSKSTFNKAFKAYMNETPSSFIKNLAV